MILFMFILFMIKCIFIAFVIDLFHNIYNKNELDFYDILLFVSVSLFICYNFPSLYVLVVTKVRFNR